MNIDIKMKAYKCLKYIFISTYLEVWKIQYFQIKTI